MHASQPLLDSNKSKSKSQPNSNRLWIKIGAALLLTPFLVWAIWTIDDSSNHGNNMIGESNNVDVDVATPVSTHGCLDEYLQAFGFENIYSVSADVAVKSSDYILSLITDNTLFEGITREEMIDIIALKWGNDNMVLKEVDFDDLVLKFSFDNDDNDDNINDDYDYDYDYAFSIRLIENVDMDMDMDSCKIGEISMVNPRRLQFDCGTYGWCCDAAWCCTFCGCQYCGRCCR